MNYDGWRLYFEQVINTSADEVDVAEAALILAADEYPELDVSHYLRQLDHTAEAVRPKLPRDRNPHTSVATLNDYLFDHLEFRGNRENYYDPRNSYLNDVLERRTGLPISLSVVYLAVARRLGLPMFGVGLPGHFIVKWQDRRQRILIDPFNQGEILDERGVQERVRDTYSAQANFQPDWLASVDARYILTRMLNNLKAIFLHTENLERAWKVVDKLLLLDPRSAEDIRDMGLISLRLGAYRRAAIYLEEYLLAHAEAADAGQIHIFLRTALSHVERLN